MNEKVIGETIRAIRESKGASLTAVADAAGISKGALSKIEKAQVSAPISTLLRVAKALNVHLSRFFTDPKGSPDYVVTRKGKAPVITRGGSEFGYTYQALALEMSDKLADPFLLTISPGDKRGIYRHGGEEFIYVLNGKMEMTLGSESFVLNAGDSIYFDPSYKHSCAALGSKPVRMIAVFIQDDRTPKKRKGIV